MKNRMPGTENETTFTPLTRWLGAAAVAAALAFSSACSSGANSVLNPPPGGGGSNLTVTNANPSDGNGTVTVTGTLVVNNAGTGFDELNLSQMVGSVGHDVTITWDTTTHAIHSVGHGWGSGYTQCVVGTANPCDSAKITIDFAGHQVAFTNLTLVDDTFGTGATCNLGGTARW